MRPDMERLLKFFLAKNFKPNRIQPFRGSINTAQSYTVRKIIRLIGEPTDPSNSKSIVKWGDKFKSRNPGLFKYLSNPNNIEELKKTLEKEKLDIYNHPYFKTLLEGKTVFAAAEVKKLGIQFEASLKIVLSNIERRCVLLESYNNMSEIAQKTLRDDDKITSKLKPYFKLGALELQRKILRVIKSPSNEKLKAFKEEDDTDSKKLKRELELSNVLKNIELLPLPLQQLLQSDSDSDMLGALRVIYGEYSAGKKQAGSSLQDMYLALKPLRGKVEEVHKAHVWSTQQLKNIDRPYQIRNPQYLITKMESLMRDKDSRGLISLVNKYVSNNNINKMTQGLNEISPALAHIFFFARTNPTMLKLEQRTELYEKEKNKSEMESFKASISQVTEAILNPAKLKALEAKGFNMQKFLKDNKSNRATKVMYDLQTNVLTSLMESKDSLLSSLRENEELNNWFKSKQAKLLKMNRYDRDSLIKGTVLHISKGLLKESKNELLKEIKTYYGNSIQEAFGDAFYNGFINKTINTYYSNSVMSYLRATVVRELTSMTNIEDSDFVTSGVNPSEMGFKGMSWVLSRLQKLKHPGSGASTIKNVHDLETALTTELEDLKKNNSYGSRAVSNLILDITETTGKHYLENKILIDKIKDIANLYSRDIELYVTARKNSMRTRGGSGDVHPTETQLGKRKPEQVSTALPAWHPLRIMKEKFLKTKTKAGVTSSELELQWLEHCQKEGINLEKAKRKGFELKPDHIPEDRSPTKRKREFDPLRQKREDEAKQKRLTLDLLKHGNPKLERLIRSSKSTRGKTGIEQDEGLRAALKSIYDQNIAMGYSGKQLDSEVERQYKKYLAKYSRNVYEHVGKDPDFKKAARMAKIQSLANRYDEMKGMFTLQGDLGNSKRTKRRNNSIVSEGNLQAKEVLEKNLEAERIAKGVDAPGMGSDPLMGQYDEAVARSDKKGGNTEGYIFKHSYSSIPYMIEQAKTPEELTEVRNFINDIIPLKYLRSVERITAPEYTVYDESDKTKKPLKFDSLTTFMGHHEERILKSRADEIDGIHKTGAQPI